MNGQGKTIPCHGLRNQSVSAISDRERTGDRITDTRSGFVSIPISSAAMIAAPQHVLCQCVTSLAIMFFR